MKKSIIKRLFIKLSKVLGYEIIDQSDFNSPTLQKKLTPYFLYLELILMLRYGIKIKKDYLKNLKLNTH